MRVLVVEDDRDIREALSDTLVEHGCEVFAVEDGRAALDRLELVRPDVILLDLVMRDMDGWTFRGEQRKRGSMADIPVVVMTGLGHVSTHGLAVEALLTKPFTVDAVLSAISQAARNAAPSHLGHAAK